MELLEKLDSKIFTTELKNEVKTEFDKAVVEAVELQVEEKFLDLEESSKKFIDEQVLELSEAKEVEIKEASDAKLAEEINKLVEYTQEVVDNYLEDNKLVMDESIEKEKMTALLEGFDALLVTGGVELQDIAEAKAELDEDRIGDLETKVNSLMESNIELKAKNADMLKLGLTIEAKAELNVVEQEKFDKLAGIVEFNETDADEFVARLAQIVESVKGTKQEVKEEKVVETKTVETDKMEMIKESYQRLF